MVLYRGRDMALPALAPGEGRGAFFHSRVSLLKDSARHSRGLEGVMTSEKIFERGYRIKESRDKTEGGEEPGWYYGRADDEGGLSEKVGPFETWAEAMKHLEEELFADDED